MTYPILMSKQTLIPKSRFQIWCWRKGNQIHTPTHKAQMQTTMITQPSFLFLSYLSQSLADCWRTTEDFTTGFLHSSQFSAFHSRPVHSLMLSFHHFLCLTLRLRPWTVPCRIVLASPDDRVTCPYHFSLRLFTEVKRSSYGPRALPILAFTSSLVMLVLSNINI